MSKHKMTVNLDDEQLAYVRWLALEHRQSAPSVLASLVSATKAQNQPVVFVYRNGVRYVFMIGEGLEWDMRVIYATLEEAIAEKRRSIAESTGLAAEDIQFED